ncbi:MAG: 50S ribosomal protein L24 [Candidatus Gracilibacteria bacterium]|nr:50S ribosomal protein L24 [Candidatus Gracilibacteria bacterium]
MKIHSGDLVQVIAGKDKGKQGKVISVFLKEERVLVEGINIVKKAIKKQGVTPGRFVEMEKSVHVSNVAVLDPDTKKPSRVGFNLEGSRKIRISKKSGKSLA